jgi:hypothetical protein
LFARANWSECLFAGTQKCACGINDGNKTMSRPLNAQMFSMPNCWTVGLKHDVFEQLNRALTMQRALFRLRHNRLGDFL